MRRLEMSLPAGAVDDLLGYLMRCYKPKEIINSTVITKFMRKNNNERTNKQNHT